MLGINVMMNSSFGPYYNLMFLNQPLVGWDFGWRVPLVGDLGAIVGAESTDGDVQYRVGLQWGLSTSSWLSPSR
jgi:hypothetical protein